MAAIADEQEAQVGARLHAANGQAIALLHYQSYTVIRVGVGLGLGSWIGADGGGGVLSTFGRS